MLDYLDFELEIGADVGGEYPVHVVRSPAGEAADTVRFPLNEQAIARALDKLQIALLRSGGARRTTLLPEEKAVQDFGRALFGMALSGNVLRCYDLSFQKAAEQGKGLRLKLRFAAPELAVLPWEFLYDERQSEYVCLSSATPLVRYIETLQPPAPLAVSAPLRVLGMVSSPSDLTPLDVERERDAVEKAIAPLRAKGLIELEWLKEATWPAALATLRRGPWHIFHFIGHGDFDAAHNEGRLVLVNEHGKASYFRATELARLLNDHRSLRLAVLNACRGAYAGEKDLFSSTASILVRRGLPAVVAMQYEISDGAAIEFARAFYEALADDYPVDAAVAEARKAVSLGVANSLEWGTPVLFMRAPDGRLFNVSAKDTPSVASAPERQARETREQAERAAREKSEKEIQEKEEFIQRFLDPARKAKPEPATPRPVEAPRVAALPDRLTLERPFKLELLRIPAGEFLMGSDPAKDKEAGDDEKPQHRVFVSEFYMARYPVTNAQYAAFVTTAKVRAPSYWKSAAMPTGQGQHPVVNVSWNDAAAFCEWLTSITSSLLFSGWRVRLPTEAEWEKVARADGRIYPWGNVWGAAICNSSESKIGGTTPVGQFSPAGDSPYGCGDVAGNVREWCLDAWDEKAYQQSKGEVKDPYYYQPTYEQVLRGGAWDSDRRSVRCAVRNWNRQYNFSPYSGFRVCASPILHPR